MEPDKLQCTNRLLHDLERKLSLASTSSSNYTAQSHGSVVQDAAYAGLAKQNIHSSVLRYIKDNGSDFDADGLYADRQQRFATTFAQNYTPEPGAKPAADGSSSAGDGAATSAQPSRGHGAGAVPEAHSSDCSDYSDNYDTYYDGDDDGDTSPRRAAFGPLVLEDLDESDGADSDIDDMLLPPSPPRSPPRDIDPDKLYGLYDFSGPDPSHCTLTRDEPVYLVNDSDNYWWLVKKLTKAERAALHHNRLAGDAIASDDEDGKIGFVPAECLETYTERLARLNCFKNEELERAQTLPLALATRAPEQEEPQPLPALGRSGSILKKNRSYNHTNKSVTFENLTDLNLDEEDDSADDVLGFKYYSVDRDEITRALEDPERHSEVLSDVFPAEVPLNVKKSQRKNAKSAALADFPQPQLVFADNDSIGTYSPDTPPARKVASDHEAEDNHLRRSVILDRLNIVASSIQSSENDSFEEPAFGGCLEDYHATTEDDCGSESSGYGAYHNAQKACYDSEEEASSSDPGSRKSLSVDDLNTPVASVNSLTNTSTSPGPERRRPKKPMPDMYLPILGKLDELTEKLAELEYIL